MERSDKQRKPVAIKNLSELKRFIQPGVEFKTLSQKNHPDLVGLTRVVTTVQTVCFYSKIKDQPNSRFSTDNGGKGFRTDFAKADAYIFDGTTVKVKDTRNKDRGVIYEFEFYDREQTMQEDTNMDRKMVNFIREQYPPGTRIRLNSMEDPYAPIAPGTEGEVDFVDDIGTIHMKWDNGRALGIVPGEDSFSVLPPKLTTLKLYMPLTADFYERSEYGDLEPESTMLDGCALRGYQDQIMAELVKNRMPEETERGLMHWYHEADSVNTKVHSAVFTVEERDRKLWGVAECRIAGELSALEMDTLKEYIAGQASNAFTRESYKFIDWNTAADGSGATYADEGAILELTGDMTLYAQWQFWNGWLTDVNGKQYYKDGELLKTGWTIIDGNTYYLDTETGYAATGITTLVPDGTTEEARCVFDAEGVFQSDVTGVYSVGADTYWLNSGIIEEEAGLKRVVKEDGEVNYYYFAVQKNLEERDGLTLSAAVKSTLLNGKDCWLHKTNGLALPEWGYYFDENGVILHDEDTGKNGILKDGEDLFYYVDGIKAPAGMIKIGDDYYYANSKGQLIVNQTYYCSRMNGLMEEGTYAFDAEGKLIQGATDKNGIVKDDDGVLRYYVNGKVTYVGLIEIDGDFYYVRSNGEVVTDCVYWITWTHGLKEAGYYTFDENGKLTGTPKNGIVEEDGVLHYYVNGKLTYAGLIKIGDDYYYVNSKCEVVRDCDYYISWTHDLLPQGKYHFDADGKLTGSVAPLKNGIYEEDGSLYFYRNGERAYAGLIQIDGDYYYVRSTCEVVHDRSYYVYWTHGLMPEGYYNFDSAGRMILDSKTE